MIGASLAINLALGFATNFLLSLFAPTQKQEGPRLNDLSAPKSAYGAAIPRVYGSVRLAGNLIWSKNIREVVTTQRQGGKGGGGGGVESTTYAYYGSFAAMLCEGPIIGVKRIWLNSKLVYNIAPDADADTIAMSSNFTQYFRQYPGTFAQGQDSLIVADKGINDTPAYRGRAYLVFEDLPLAEYGNRLPTVSVEVVQHGYYSLGRLHSVSVAVASIIQNVCNRVGFNLADIDTTEVADIFVAGFWTNQSSSARDAIAQLQKAFFFDALESGGKLKFIKQIRPGSAIAIPKNDLACYEYGQDRPDSFKEIRTQDTELPDECSVTYTDAGFAYQQNSQVAIRQVSPNKNKLDAKFDIVLDASTALAIARKILYLAWAQRRSFEFNLSLKYASIEPGDVLSIPFYGSSQLVYLRKVNVGANLLLECEATIYEPSLIALTAVADPPEVSLNIGNPSNTDLKLLDIALIKDSDVDMGIYALGSGNSAWRNASVWISRNNGGSYDFAKSLLTKSVFGSCSTTLGSASEYVRDLANTLTVVVNGELESVSEFDFLNGRNIALVGSEIIFFKNAVLTAPSTYVLSVLLRGQRGTEWAIASHAASESFYLLSGYIERIAGQPLDLNTQRLYKAPINGQAIADLTPTAFTSVGRSLVPYAPCHIKGVRNVGGDLTISWIRRDRKGSLLLDYQDAPMSEASESYQVDIMNGVTVVRTLFSSSPSVVYAAADQVIDFGSAQSSVSFRVYQISAYVGRGYASVATV